MNYKLIKNEDWKEVCVNGDVRIIPSVWNISSVEDSIEMEKNTKNSQIPSSNILESGLLPVIGQEVKFISGYTNNNKYLIANKNNPTIVFGDHSCTLKMIDFNYVLGGDGAKVFKGNKTVNTKFLYYAIRQLNIKNDGYKRHFSLLKEKEINVPPLKHQSSIADILSNQESMISNMESLIEKYETRQRYLSEELLSGRLRVKEVDGKTVFYKNKEWKEVEVNGDIKEIPVDWDVEKIRDLFDSYIGGEYGEDKYFEDSVEAEIFTLYVFGGNNSNKEKVSRYIKKSKIKSRMLQVGDILLEKSGGTVDFPVGRMVQFSEGDGKIYSAVNFINILKTSAKNNKDFVFSLLSFFYKSGVTKKYEQRTTNIANLKVEEFLNHEISYDKNVHNQKLIRGVLQQQEKLIKQQKELLEKEKKKFDFLLNNLLSGNYLVEDID